MQKKGERKADTSRIDDVKNFADYLGLEDLGKDALRTARREPDAPWRLTAPRGLGRKIRSGSDRNGDVGGQKRRR